MTRLSQAYIEQIAFASLFGLNGDDASISLFPRSSALPVQGRTGANRLKRPRDRRLGKQKLFFGRLSYHFGLLALPGYLAVSSSADVVTIVSITRSHRFLCVFHLSVGLGSMCLRELFFAFARAGADRHSGDRKHPQRLMRLTLSQRRRFRHSNASNSRQPQ